MTEPDQPQTPAEASLPAIRAALDTLSGDLAEAAEILNAGGDVVLDGVDVRVEAACAAISSLRPEVAKSLEPRLRALVSALDALAQGVRRRKSQLEGE
jgi:hypothetical protein